MSTPLRFTSADLDAFPENDGKRYEIIDGELYVARQPHFNHQSLCFRVCSRLQQWSEQFGDGEAVIAPGLIFAEDDAVAPDVIWASSRRLAEILRDDGKLHAAQELVVEVLSAGAHNERRDYDAKLKLYSRRGVEEYWIVDWHRRRVDVFRRRDTQFLATATLSNSDSLTTTLLPGFSCRLADLFKGM